MDEQYIEEHEKMNGPQKDNHHLTLVLATVIILIIAAVFIFIARYNNSQEPVMVEDNTPAPVTEVTPAKQLSPEEEAAVLAEFNANQSPQLAENTPPGLPPAPDANTPGLVSCFEYYNFGSVQVQVSPYRGEYSNSDPVLLGGDITNNNPYPVVGGQVYMKIFKLEQESEEYTRENGYPLIDFVLVKDDVNIAANGSVPLEFEWKVPANVAGGEYQAAFFFTTEHRYNLLGLSFTDDVTGNTANFTINSDTNYQPVVFNKNSARLSDTRHSFALPPRHFDKDEQAVAYATLVNDSNEARTIELTWTYSKWDGILDSNQVSTETQTVVIQPNSELEVANETPILDSAVTFLQLSAKDGDATSMLQIRYVRDDVGETRINYPSLFSYPLKAGEETTIFSCLHSTNEPVVTDNTLTLTLTDNKGKTIHSYTYEGDVTGAMMGVKDTFVPKKDLTDVTLTAKLAHKGKTVEEVSIEYKCADIDPTLCSDAPEETEEPIVTTTDTNQNPITIIVTIIILLLLIGGGYLLTRKKTLTSDNQ